MITARKRIIISILAMVCMQSLLATTSPGENIWQMVKDVGMQTDTIATLATAASGGCTTTITQADVASKIYTISQPGLYCLSENLTSGFNPIITINASNVVLDLQHHTITGNSLNDVIRTDTVPKDHVAIQNGTIRFCGGGIALAQNIDVLLIEDLQILDTTGTGIRTGFGAILMTNILINRCNFATIFTSSSVRSIFLNANGTQKNNIVIKNCYMKCPGVNPNYSTFSNINNLCMYNCYLQGEGINIIANNNFLLKNITSAFAGGIAQQGPSTNGVVDNCVVVGPLLASVASFPCTSLTNSIIQRCVSINAANFGITISSTTNNLIKECIAMNSTQYGIVEDLATNINAQHYANIARGNGTGNYFNVTVAPVVTTPTAATSYWANIN